MNVTIEELNRNLNSLRVDVTDSHATMNKKIDTLDGRMTKHDIERAETRGAVRMLTYLVGIGLAGPSAVLAWMILTGTIGG